jgi:outer membrane protein TolC
MRKHVFLGSLFFCLFGNTQAQIDTKGDTAYSLQECIDYAFLNANSIKNAVIDTRISTASGRETKAGALPQINGNVQLTDNILIPTTFIPGGYFPGTVAGEIAPVKFGAQYTGAASIVGTQILFDASYIAALQGSKTVTELSRKALVQSKIQTIEAVTKAYYAVLVFDERFFLIEKNVSRVDSLYKQTQAQYEQGFVEKIDVDRLEVTYNNLLVDREKAVRTREVTLALLKFQMGMDVNKPIVLQDKLTDLGMNEVPIAENSKIEYSNRIEYGILKGQNRVAFLKLKNAKLAYLPKLNAIGNVGANYGKKTPIYYFDFNNRTWFGYTFVGLQMQLPIFDGNGRAARVQQARLNLQKNENDIKYMEQTIDLQIKQSAINYENNMLALKVQLRNMQLALEVVRVTKVKYQAGVGSNLEVLVAETSYREAQTNYYAALFDALVSKVDMAKASGTLLK